MVTLSSPRSLAGRLPALLSTLARQADAPFYLVGGSVRDLLLGRPATDYDLVLEGDAVALARSVASKHGGRLSVHTRFQTAVWEPDEAAFDRLHVPAGDRPALKALDFISARSETYKQSAALPTVRRGTIRDDICRRDFTINTLAVRLDGRHFGEFLDLLEALDDLAVGRVRVLHPGSFLDDPTRMIRAVRYEQRYDFRLELNTRALISPALPGLDLLSAQRLRHELDLVLLEEKAPAIIGRLDELGILARIHPALTWDPDLFTRFYGGFLGAQLHTHFPADLLLAWSFWLMDLPAQKLRSVDKRLHFDAATRKMLLESSALQVGLPKWVGGKPSQCVARLDRFSLRAVQAVYLAAPPGESRQLLENYLEIWRTVHPRTTGHTLLKQGLPPGPAFQRILRQLRAARLDGEIASDEQERQLLERLVRRERARS